MSGGLDRLDLTSGKLGFTATTAGDPATLPADGVMSLYEDRLGTLWIGTFRGGLASIDRATDKITRYPFGAQAANSLSSSKASAIVEDSLGNLWIGTAGGGLNLFERKSGRFYAYRRDDQDRDSLSDDTVYALHLDPPRGFVGGHRGRRPRSRHRQLGAARRRAFRKPIRLGRYPSQVVYGIESDRETGFG